MSGELRHPDGSLHQFMVEVNGKSFRCDCGCNVFHKPKDDPDVFICNACGAYYRGEQ